LRGISLSTMWAVGRYERMADFVAAAHRMGFGGIELNYQLTPPMLAEIIGLWEGGRVRVSSIHDPCPTLTQSLRNFPQLSALDRDEREAAVALAKKSIELVSRLGAEALVLHLGRIEVDRQLEDALCDLYNRGKKETAAYEEAKERLIAARTERREANLAAVMESLEELVPYAAARGVKLGVESRYYYREIPLFEEAQLILDHFDSAVLLYWHDVGHVQNLENLGFARHEDWLAALSHRLLGVHLHDIVGLKDHQAAGKGEMDFAMVGRYLPEGAIMVCEFEQHNSAAEVEAGVMHLEKLGLLKRELSPKNMRASINKRECNTPTANGESSR